jgi:hypothetical protein
MSDLELTLKKYEEQLEEADRQFVENRANIETLKKLNKGLKKDKEIIKYRIATVRALNNYADLVGSGLKLLPVEVPIEKLGLDSEFVLALRKKGVETAADFAEKMVPDTITKLLGGSVLAVERVATVFNIWGFDFLKEE